MIEKIPINNTNINLQTSTDFNNLSFESGNSYEQINELFIEKNVQEKSIQEAREILDISENEYSDRQVLDLVNEVQFLVESWLDEFERKTYDGKNLDELIGSKV